MVTRNGRATRIIQGSQEPLLQNRLRLLAHFTHPQHRLRLQDPVPPMDVALTFAP